MSSDPKRARLMSVFACCCAISCVALSAVTGGCSDDGGPNTSSGLLGADAGGEGGTQFDAASITPRPELCQGLSRGREPISELELEGDAPMPLGGPISPGTYDLVELSAYAGEREAGAPGDDNEMPHTRKTGKAAQITIVVTQFAMRTIEARGASGSDATTWPEAPRAVLYRVDGASLVSTAVCPTTALPVTMPYTAVGGGLAIFVDKTHREVYSLRPEGL